MLVCYSMSVVFHNTRHVYNLDLTNIRFPEVVIYDQYHSKSTNGVRKCSLLRVKVNLKSVCAKSIKFQRDYGGIRGRGP